MKKQQLLQTLINNNVKSTNVKSFINRNKKLNIDYKKAVKYLEEYEEKEAKKRRKEHLTKQAKEFKMSVKMYKQLQQKAETILSDFHTGHSMGCYRTLKINGVSFAWNSTLSSYAASCSYSPTYGQVTINLTKTDLINIEKIEGVWTIKGKKHACKWLESFGSKHRYEINIIKGYLFGDTHGTTLEKAKEDFRKKYIQRKMEKLKNSKFVGVDYIRGKGACIPGIKSFIQRHNLNIEYGYTIGFLKSLEPQNSFLIRL
jgi:hypothetical protein